MILYNGPLDKYCSKRSSDLNSAIFLKAWKEPVQMVCSNLKFRFGHVFLFSGKDHGL